MAKIEPFRAIVYNQGEIKSISSVVCPPYDVISPAQQQYYHDLNPHNLIHLLLSKDSAQEDRYRVAAQLFKDWQKDKVLIPDKSPAVYFYSQQYNLKGEKRTRLGFIARLYLEDKKSGIFTHEHTRLEAKEDRFKLLKAAKANLSPIFVVFKDKKRIIQYLHQKYAQGKTPFIDIVDIDKTVHKIWRLDSSDVLDVIRAKMLDEDIFIADGHHRYEVACAYRDEMKKKAGAVSAEAPFNYVLAYFTNTNPAGLTILPIHRLVKLNSKPDIEKLMLGMKEYFDVDEVKDKVKFFFAMEKGGRSEHLIGMYYDKKYRLLRLKNIKILDKMISDKPLEYRSLDVSILNYIVLKKILGLDLDNKDAITFTPDAQQMIEKADNDGTHIAFFLNPVRVEQIISLALTGENMPPKSTYFYPKVLSGLVINKHEDI